MMKLFHKEQRNNPESPQEKITPANFLQFFGLGSRSSSGIVVDVDNALGIPAVWGAVNFLSGTIAGLPLNVFRKSKGSRKKLDTGIASVLKHAVNPGMSSFEWRKYSFERVFTGGRSLTLIDRNIQGKVTDLWPLDPNKATIKVKDGQKKYVYTPASGVSAIYDAGDIIDIPFMLKPDGVSAIGPLISCRDSIGMSIAATQYASKYFEDGGVPPFAITGPFHTGKAMKRAGEDLQKAIRQASTDRRLALPLPSGHDLKSLGGNLEDAQMVELKKFLNEEIARIYSLPVVFIQDLSKGTFSNTEQQDLHLVKHTIKRWVEQTEQELNLKLFGRANTRIYCEFNLDGLLRGDFKTRMEGYATGIQNAILKPMEARRKENLEDDDYGNYLMIQSATVPIKKQMKEEVENES